ncbi:MAG: hypothetical protein LBT97_03875 [Planctomycetota bacterium]|nr:hypothetical protein [Planctomycetota bacterium]
MPDGIVKTEAWMVDDLAGRIRPEHEREINALLPMRAGEVLRYGVGHAASCYAGIREGTVLFIVGVEKPGFLTGSALGWLLGCADMDRHGVWIAERSRETLPVLHRESGAARIENQVPADYHAALKWLRWLGFRTAPGSGGLTGTPHVKVWHDWGHECN